MARDSTTRKNTDSMFSECEFFNINYMNFHLWLIIHPWYQKEPGIPDGFLCTIALIALHVKPNHRLHPRDNTFNLWQSHIR